MKKPRPAANPDSSNAAYLQALRWLGARELSEGQVRERLAIRGYVQTAVDVAVARLLENRTLDDRRTATTVARVGATVRHQGPRRIMGRLLALRIDRELAQEVVREQFGDDEEHRLIEIALNRRLRGDAARLADPHERRRILAYLVRQGFSASAASALMRTKSK